MSIQMVKDQNLERDRPERSVASRECLDTAPLEGKGGECCCKVLWTDTYLCSRFSVSFVILVASLNKQPSCLV